MGIRTATRKDWPRIIEIYNEAVDTGYSTGDTEHVSVESKIEWFEEHDDQYPIYLDEVDGIIQGWCSLSPYRKGRRAFRYTAELSYYVSKEFWRQGVATRLVEFALKEARRLGFKNCFGILLDTNAGSIRLLEKFNFEQWGHMPGIADFDRQECGHVYMGKRIKESFAIR